jgi:hypothetical protein
LLKQIEGLDEDQLYEDYSIEVVDGIVYDDCYNREFNSLTEWAEFTVENDGLDEPEEDEPIYRKYLAD